MLCEEIKWDVNVVNDLFEDRDKDLILSIPLNTIRIEDQWYWLHENSGCYSVKSSYKWLQETKGQWSAAMESSFWRVFWKTKVPPKVLHFAWKAVCGCLPTRVQLQTKHVPVQLHCVLCNREEESIMHVLVQCQFARSCWSRSAVSLGQVAAATFGDWLQVQVAADVVLSARTVLNQWNNARSNRFEPLPAIVHTLCTSEHWIAPELNWVKVNVDGATFASTQSYGVGGIARGSDGRLIEAFCLHKDGCVQPSLVEAIGVKEALSWIKEKGWQRIILETDSLVVVQALESNVEMQSIFGSVIIDCINLLNSLVNVYVRFVKRSANNTAHCLARGACYWSDCIFVSSNVPSTINTAVSADLAFLS
uniref:RNase H type-1 domain-containing protein n=1 Tax=Cannabis sativa TaxID=3483 RepID=A0A803PEZ1_CANSA